ncbi:MAG: tryptophan-rich sensory protein [Candidatus Pacebacteria bacterium]|nr:tryptophan-rich sensory protein [Candidatus Paceibacterota bacterium]
MKLNHLAIPYLAVLAFMFGGILNSGGIAWYHTLMLPVWNPSAGMIVLIWAVIYVLAAWSLLIVWNTLPRDRRFAWIMGGYVVSVLLNLVWSVVFFHLHLLGAAVWSALLLGVAVLVLMILIYPRSPKASLLLLPYTAWVFFAAYLNYTVMLLN